MSYGIPIIGEKEHQLKNINLEIRDGAFVSIQGLVKWKEEIFASYEHVDMYAQRIGAYACMIYPDKLYHGLSLSIIVPFQKMSLLYSCMLLWYFGSS